MPTKILVLTQDDCAFCDDAQEVLKRLQDVFDLEIISIDINTEKGVALAAMGGVLFAPGIFVGDRPFSYGRLSERRLRRHLEQNHCHPRSNRLDAKT